MSQENVERLRAGLGRFFAGTSEAARDDMLSRSGERWDPGIELDASESTALDISGVYRGRDAVEQFWREWLAAWEAVRSEYELIDAGDHVVMLFDMRMRGRSTGIDVPLEEVAWVFTYRRDLLIRATFYMCQAAALKAVGLEE